MNKKFIGLLILFVAFSMTFTACQRSASLSPTISTTPTQNQIPFPVATQPQIMADILKQTQTSMAQTQQSGNDFPMVTNTPEFIFNTPSANNTPTPQNTPISGINTPQLGTITPAVGGDVPPFIAITPSPMAYTSSLPTTAATTAPTAIAYPTPTPGHPATYTIQAGEYLWCLARRFNVNIADIYSLNGMNSNSQPRIGTVIKLPASGSFGGTRARNPHPAIYTVRAGDSIGGIACWYGDADPNTIFAANGLPAGSVITVGQVLQIP